MREEMISESLISFNTFDEASRRPYGKIRFPVEGMEMEKEALLRCTLKKHTYSAKSCTIAILTHLDGV